MIVRDGRLEDLEWVVEEARKFCEFFGSHHSLFNEEHLREVVVPSLIQDHVFLVAEDDDGRRLGFITGLLTGAFLNPKLVALSEVAWWVEQTARGGRAGVALLDKYIEIGKAAADWITMTLEEKSPVKAETLEKRGFKLHERAYLLEVA